MCGVCSSMKYLRSRFCALSRRYSLLARKSESGVKSSASAAQARSITALLNGCAEQHGFAVGGAFRDRGHAAEGHAGVADHAVFHAQVEGGADGRNVVVQTFGDLVGAERCSAVARGTMIFSMNSLS